jgi:hypothetical protein
MVERRALERQPCKFYFLNQLEISRDIGFFFPPLTFSQGAALPWHVPGKDPEPWYTVPWNAMAAT